MTDVFIGGDMTLFRPVGLTLLEVVVILALLSVLAISALPAFYAYRYRAHVSAKR